MRAGLEQMLHHIGSQCKRLTAAAAADRAAAARRCLDEVVRLVSALQASAAWAQDAVLSRRCGAAAQVLLLHLVKVRRGLGICLHFVLDCEQSGNGAVDIFLNIQKIRQEC